MDDGGCGNGDGQGEGLPMAAVVVVLVSNEREQKVFGLSGPTISERIAAAARAAGLGEGYSGHSCRVGMAVDLAEAGATMPQLQAVGRWKSSQTVARYVGAQFAGRSVVAQLYSRKRKGKA